MLINQLMKDSTFRMELGKSNFPQLTITNRLIPDKVYFFILRFIICKSAVDSHTLCLWDDHLQGC